MIFALCVWAKSTRALFSREQSVFLVSISHSAPRDSVSAAAEAARRLRSWGLQMELAGEFERGINLSCPSADDESELSQDLADEGEDGVLSLLSLPVLRMVS